MKITELNDKILESHPHVYRNNRGCLYNKNGTPVYYGIPEIPRGKKKDLMKGGDFIGFTMVKITPDMIGQRLPVFTNIEAKTKTDTLKQGQINWHNFILMMNGISEIWKVKKDNTIDKMTYKI